ncbi:MAG TPA: two-component regulator propeller domain-containing protein, partial [Candidatus Sulfotelmatobacter sp.]|nr:two-component regulator propeller domain-containing protein [Candidatus Sulfotelmatobacter sp.]
MRRPFISLAQWWSLDGLGAACGSLGPRSWLWLVVVVVCLHGRLCANEQAQVVAPAAPLPGALEGDHVLDFWRTGQGLPHNVVNAVLQTRDGYLWVGTAGGLARFDGWVFTPVGEETVGGLKDATVTALMEDREGGLWVGTQDRGVFRLRHGQTARFTRADGLADNSVTSLAEDEVGCLWIGTQGGLNRWDKGTLSAFASPLLPAGDSIVALYRGHSGALWITTRSGVFRLKGNQAVPFQAEVLTQGQSGEFKGVYEDRSGNLWGFGSTFLLNLTQGRRFNYFRSLELASSRVWTICEQGDGTFWIGTSGRGLFRFQSERFEVAGVREGLDQCDVRALHVDNAGNLWIGTRGNGLARLRTRRFRFLGPNEGLTAQAVSALAAGAGDKLWVGTLDSGLFCWDGRRLEPFRGGPPLDRVTQVQTLCMDRQGALWVGTWGAGLWRVAQGQQQRFGLAEGLSDDVVLAVAADPKSDTVWAGTREGSLHRLRNGSIETFTTAAGLSGKAIGCLLAGEQGDLFIGAEAGGLRRWDGQAFASVPVPPELAASPVRCLFQDRKGRLWVGTWGGGAFCRQGRQWRRLSIGQGLGSDLVGQICQDEAGDFWFGTEENLFKARASEMESYLRGGRESVGCIAGIPEEELGQLKCAAGWPSVARNANGGWWMATRTGLLPLGARNRILAEPPPPVIIEQVLVNGRPVPLEPGKPLRLGPAARSLDFIFTGVSFTAPQKVRFRHKLENFDADWVEGGLARRAHYGPLPPGQYRFHVIAANANGAWNETGACQEFVVVPALWRAWWFLTLLGVVAAGAIWAVARFISVRRLQARLRIARQQHAMERERAR